MRTRFLAILILSCAICAQYVSAQTQRPRKNASTSKSTSRPKKKTSPVRIRRIQRAFVASTDLKPMARQLLETRSKAGYAAVEAYARRHASTDAGTLANLVLAYAHVLDREPAKAIAPLKLAQARPAELGDYITYFLGSAYQANAQSNLAIAELRDFATKYPDSVFLQDAAVVYANAMVAAGSPEQAIPVLEKYRRPTRVDLELALGRALLRAGNTEKAADTLRHVYYSMPLSAEADTAGELLTSSAGGLSPNFALQKSRSDLLLQGRRFRDAAAEYRQLLQLAPDQDRPAIQVSIAACLHRSGDDRQARDILEHLALPAGESNAERWFYLLEIARSDNDEDRLLRSLVQLRDSGPTSSWLEQGLLAAGNMYLLRNDYDRAIDFYREIHERFPQGRYGAYAHWKVAWLSLREGRNDEARKRFEEQISLYPASLQVPAAMYWRGRLAEEEQDLVKAQLYYLKLSQRFRNYYYADLARNRLAALHVSGAGISDPVLEKIPPLQVAPDPPAVETPTDNLHLQKARLLQNGGLTDFAIRELKMASDDGGSSWATAEMARLYRDNGQYHRALQLLKRSVPSYFAMDFDALPRPYWEDLFPRPFWTDLKRYASSNGLDPYLVASLIRQESEFNPAAISHANAVGLMQVLPTTGKKLARQMKVRRFSSDQLLQPGVNLQLGTRYFRELLDQFGGRLEYALAAYNAGTDRVEAWLANGKYRDPQEFVESIPFSETREYVQAILRNVTVYKRLYGTP